MNDHEPCILCDNGEEALCDAREFIRMAERCGEMTPHPPPTPEECEDVKSVQKSSYSTSPFFSNSAQTGKVGREFIRMAGVDEVLASPEFQAGIDEIMRDTLRKFVQHDNSLLKPRSIGATKPKGLPATWLQDELTRMAQEYGLYGGEE